MTVGRFRAGYRALSGTSAIWVPGYFGVAQTYIEKVLSYSPIAYWPMSETSGTTAENAEGTAARDGTFARNVTTMTTGTGIGDGNTAPLFTPGSSDTCSIGTANLASAIDSAEGTFSIWIKVSGSGVWNDSTNRAVYRLAVDANNEIYIRKQASQNDLLFQYKGQTVGKTILYDIGSARTDWIHLAHTWSITGDAHKGYLDGSQVGSTQTSLTDLSGAFNTAAMGIGSYDNIPNQPWDGYLAHAALWTSALSDADIAVLATV